jgi:hypothetical protein
LSAEGRVPEAGLLELHLYLYMGVYVLEADRSLPSEIVKNSSLKV